MGFLRELTDAWSQRIKSPIIGSVAFSFILINWKPLWYLFLADRPVRQKFLFFDANTDNYSLFIYPILLGTAISILIPWISFGGAYLAQKPFNLLRQLQHDSSHQQKVYELQKEAERVQANADLEAAKEQAKIDAARRLEEAKSVGGEALEEDIKESRNATANTQSHSSNLDNLSETELGFLLLIGSDRSGKYNFETDITGDYKISLGTRRFTFKGRQQMLLAHASISSLAAHGLLDKNQQAITTEGYEKIEQIKSSDEYDYDSIGRSTLRELFVNS